MTDRTLHTHTHTHTHGCPCGNDCPTLRNGNQPNSAERYACEPAPTVHFGHRMNDVRWLMDRRQNGAPVLDVGVEPCPTITGAMFAKGIAKVWREEHPEWAYERPATTVVGSFCPDVIAAPGYRTQESRQNAEASIKVTVAEASILQSFRPDYPFQGSRSAQFRQVGDAVPPLLAAHVLSAATGLPFLSDAEEVA